MEKQQIMIRLPHGYYKGGGYPLPDVCPTIDAHIACWHVLIGEIEMEEIKCKQVEQINSSGYTEMTGRVYDKECLSPSIRTFGGGNTEVKILEEPLAYDEQNGYLREDGIVGSLTTDGSSPKHNNRVVEPIIIDDTYGFEDKARIYEDCPTIRADRQGLKVAEPVSTRGSDIASTLRASMHKQGARNLVQNMKNGLGYEGIIEPLVYDGFNQQIRADSSTSGAITRNVGADLKRNGQGSIEPQQFDYRVRKLTEKECFRLQGVKDEDFTKVRKNQSKSSCYHLAGDSITTSVLMALFGEMLDIDWRKKVNDLVEELQDKESDNDG